MPNTIMTEKIARRGVSVPSEYRADFLEQRRARDFCSKPAVTLSGEETVARARELLVSYSHQGFPVLGREGELVGVLTRRDLAAKVDGKLSDLLKRAPISIRADQTLSEAADLMARERIGRLPVLEGAKVVGVLTRSDLMAAQLGRLRERENADDPAIRLPLAIKPRPR